jgi:alpha-beta hydrolase superfamily lysophospholipase
MSELSIEPSKLDTAEILSSLFSPVRQQKSSGPASSIDLEIQVDETGITLGCRLHISDKEAPFIIFFHGNGETVGDYDDIAQSYTQNGMNILIVTYRGYGWSSGTPSVASLYRDNLIILDFVTRYTGDNNYTGPCFIMGRSLGSACAIDLVHRHPDRVKGLIIDSGFADSLPLARRLGYDLSNSDITEEDCFNNVSKIQSISLPTLIIHGALDQLIPVPEAEKLQAESGARTKQFQVIPGADHNSLIDVAGALYFETIKKFIDTVTGQNNWRLRRKKFKNKEGL